MSEAFERLSSALSDRYRIEQEIGRGGMATVYRAWDLKNRRGVALKALSPELSSAVTVERFLREIETTGNLTHPHIVPLFDSDAVDGILFYVMPIMEGGTLRKRLVGHCQLDIDEAVRITCEVAEALGYAHSRGIIHRDIKPDNILFFSNGLAVVGDFGIARAVMDPRHEDLTVTGVKIGTPAYMSPEQIAGDDLDGRTDIYSLGCVLYEMLVGEVPFNGPTAQSVFARQVIDPVPPIRTVRPAVPPGVERAVLKALTKTPVDRFASAQDFAKSLLARASVPTQAPRASVAVLPFDNVSGEQGTDYFSDGITEEIINTLGQVPGLHVAAATSSFAVRGAGASLEEIGEKLRVATVLRGKVQRAGSHLRVTVQLSSVAQGFVIWSQRYDRDVREATDIFAVQDDIAKAVSDRLLASIGEASFELPAAPPTKSLEAYTLYLEGRHHWAQRGPGLKKALDLFSRALALDPNYAAAHAGLADCCIMLAEYGVLPHGSILPKARAAIQQALELAPNLPEALCASGELAVAFDWDWARGDRDLRRAIELSPRHVAAHYRLALYLGLVAGKFDEAVMLARRAIELDPLAPLPHAQLGVVLMAAGRYEEAIAASQRATEVSPAMFVTYLTLGVLYNHAGRTGEAIDCLETAAAASGRQPAALTALAGCYRSGGEVGKVEAIYDELSARARVGYIQQTTLAMAAAAAGRADEAFDRLARACDEHDYILIYSKRHLGFSVLHGDPRMADIYRRVGFPE
jgi:eukaryotic-like serine/threonine-protein kinase